MTTLPVESLGFGPVGLCRVRRWALFAGAYTAEATHPTMTGCFSASIRSISVSGATSGSGCHSLTSSSISCYGQPLLSPILQPRKTYIF
jgi:hypothetical protein